MIDYASHNYMAFTDELLGLGHWSNDGPTSHPRIFFEQKENLNLLVACALPLCIGNSEAVFLETLLYSCEWKTASPICNRLKKVTNPIDSTHGVDWMHLFYQPGAVNVHDNYW